MRLDSIINCSVRGGPGDDTEEGMAGRSEHVAGSKSSRHLHKPFLFSFQAHTKVDTLFLAITKGIPTNTEIGDLDLSQHAMCGRLFYKRNPNPSRWLQQGWSLHCIESP